MKRIRIGKDINVQWVLHAPTGVVLTSENLTIELKDPKGRQKDIDTFTLEAQQDKFTVNFALRGTAFSQLGNYTFTAWLNKGEQGQSVVDAVNAFTLVGSTQAEDDLQSCGCGCLNTVTIDMQGDISYIGQRGEKGEKGEKGDKGNSAYEDAVEQGYDGTLEQWLASLKGEKGDRGEQGIQGVAGQDGQNGADGQDGQDGYSPTVSLSKSGKTTTLVIKDKNGEHTATIVDGNDGQNGQDGRDGTNGTNGTNGQDGVSPAVTVSTIQGGHRVNITDAEHPQGQSFDVMNGQDGQGVPEIFWAIYGTTTYAEISAALTSGKAVMMYYKNLIFLYGGVYNPNNNCHFTTFSNNTTIQCCEINTQTNVWTTTHSYSIITDAKIQASSTRAPQDASYYSGLKAKIMLFAGWTLEEVTGWTDSNYYNTSANPVTNTMTSNSTLKCVRIEVKEGDRYLLSLSGGIAPRAYAVTDSDGVPISVASESLTIYDFPLVIPTNAKYLYLNCLKTFNSSTYPCYKIKTVGDLEESLAQIKHRFTIVYDDNSTETLDVLAEEVL